ncbi:hypothetical protein FACS1894164_05480 [Spirochaetia bacterium]|nr:hypothetical protein FACS1894164_05480 [Spirochaetia bacterium]
MKELLMLVLSGAMVTGLGFARGGSDFSASGGILKPSDVGLQLYTIRGLMDGHEGDVDYVKRLLGEVKKVGYQNVEPYSYWGLAPDQWKQILNELGLNVTGLHHGIPNNGIANRAPVTLAAIQADVDILQGYLKAFNIDYSIINYAGYESAAEWDIFYKSLEIYVAELHRRGIKVGFHSHNHEYGEIRTAHDDEKAIPVRFYDRIVELCDVIEIDLHWAVRGGVNPVKAIEEYSNPAGKYARYHGKLQYLHMKDISIVSRDGNNVPTRFEEIGDGTINWPEVIKAAKVQGIKYYIVEQDGNYQPAYTAAGTTTNFGFSDQPQIRSIKTSFDYLSQFFSLNYRYPERVDLSLYSNKINRNQLSVQLYNLRALQAGHNGDANWILENILKPVAAIGYQNVEMYNFWGLTGTQWKSILDTAGLKVSSIHQNILDSESEIQTLVNNLKALGLNHIFIASGGFATYEQAAPFLARVEDFRKRLSRDGIAVNYHTHSQEFAQPDGNTATPFGAIVASGAKVELDIHWAIRAMRDPVDLMLKYPQAITYLHIKDLSFGPSKAAADAATETLNFHYEEIGSGIVDWDSIFRAASFLKIQYFVVEQDANYIGGSLTYGDYSSGNPLDSIKRSYDFIKNNYGGAGF